MRELKNCRKCNMVFVACDNDVLCKKCQVAEDEIFKNIREYIFNNPGTSIYDLSSRFNLSIKRIETYIMDGKLNIS